MQYFAQDEATRLDPALTVYETLAAGSPHDMVPAIRNILGGFLFSGDDVYKKAGVLSGGERTRLAVARMLLRPSNTLLLDEPTNHLDLDSKEVLLDALADYGGTLIFVSHDRYFVERLATKIIEVGDGEAVVYPGTYEEFLWSKEQRGSAPDAAEPAPARPRPTARRPPGSAGRNAPAADRSRRPPSTGADVDDEHASAQDAERRKRERARQSAAEARSPSSKRASPSARAAIKELEAAMAAPGLLRRPRRSRSR